jgi:hypothetical protein
MKTYSISSAALTLETDRRTLRAALAGVKPDAVEQGHSRWRIKTILAALDRARPEPAREEVSGERAALDVLYAKLDREIAQLRGLPTVDERRAVALALAPLMDEADALGRQVAAAAGEPVVLTELRLDKLHMVTLRGLEGPCQWTREEVLGAP